MRDQRASWYFISFTKVSRWSLTKATQLTFRRTSKGPLGLLTKAEYSGASLPFRMIFLTILRKDSLQPKSSIPMFPKREKSVSTLSRRIGTLQPGLSTTSYKYPMIDIVGCEMSSNCPLPWKRPQRRGRKNVHGRLRRVLQACQASHWASR